ncbi:exonuclease domain-containing protein [Gleimia sp. 6138-11-ORH1]|uniref:exonuclease domain-containing protein n=1 Tax=Gleimia sp. 6138-11-ORH1 TaxID=2973937 RepID=UPI00216AA187|nr:exonuclease domain-containing protein [Gleimia sp. 6138-11-ORH1]MCS4483918.1 exonuclease domain-containing protein [Gleimia sp. 6138-11-ORH1]
MSWLDGVLLGFDVESTGVDPLCDRIVTASWELRRGEEVLLQETLLFDPGVEIPQVAIDVHGITNERARAEGLQPVVGLELLAGKLVSFLSEGVPLVGFNVQFDVTMLEAELRRYSLPTVAERLGGRFAPVIDPLILDREFDRWRRGKRKLVDLLGVYGLDVNPLDLHQSDVDVSATLSLLQAMGRRFPQLGAMGLLELHDFQRAAYRRWAVDFSNWLQSKGREPLASVDWLD